MAGALRGLRYVNFSVETKGEATDSSRAESVGNKMLTFWLLFFSTVIIVLRISAKKRIPY